jgi:predicted amidohydrolase YtcJ
MELEKEGLLPVRVNYMYTFFSLDEIEGAMQYVGKDTEMVRFGGLKIFIDGAYAGGEAWTSWKNAEGGHGLWYVSTDDRQSKEYNINRIVEKVNDLGLNIHYHVQGDKAISAVLDAIENAKKNKGFLTSTHTLIHLAFPTDKQIAHMKRLAPHVVATVQPAFWQVEKDSVKYYGARAKFCYPIKKLIKAGISTGMSTDFSVSPLKLSAPTKVMNIALTGAGDPFHHKPLDLEAVIKGFTRASAATSPRRDIGTLEVGRMADMVVYDQDLYSVPKDEFNEDNPKVISTWIGGRKVRKLLD